MATDDAGVDETKSEIKPDTKPDNSEELVSLKAALSRANREAADRRKQLEAWNKLERSPDEIAELLEAQRAAELQKAEKAGEWDKLKAQLNASHEATVTKLNGEIAASKRAIEKHLIDSQATAAIAAAKGVPELLLPLVQQQVRMVEKDGSFSVQVVDTKGELRINGKGDPLSITDLVAEMRASEVYGRAFDGTGHTGGGTPPVNGNGGARRPQTQAEILAPAKGDKNKERQLRAAFMEAAGDGGRSWLALPKG